MKQIAMLEYKVMFDPSEAWSSIWEFEATLNKYFDACGFETQIVKGIDGQPNARIILLTKKPEIANTEQTDINEKKFIPTTEQINKLNGSPKRTTR